MGKAGNEGYALLDALIAIAFSTLLISGIGMLLRGSVDRNVKLMHEAGLLIESRNATEQGK